MRLKKNDTVRVITGEDRGKEGRILKVFPDKGRIIVEKVNLIKRHTRPSKSVPQGGIVEKEAPINATNVMLVCPKSGKPTRVGAEVLSDGSRARVSKKSGEMIND
ncbi:MAG: 50S ribosomal protein L24 [bacterium]|jgi:large subunit ribosomal protein L24|nr:50S ribosomal protein L24 [bacterium]MBK7672308.1 50S ribosomal protein L24 [bacterium]